MKTEEELNAELLNDKPKTITKYPLAIPYDDEIPSKKSHFPQPSNETADKPHRKCRDTEILRADFNNSFAGPF